VHHARRQDVGARSEDLRKPSSQEAQPLAHGNAALQQKGPDLIDWTLIGAGAECVGRE
jgi:hypothetical protein